ncbi:MAG: hypothetical protein U1E20_09620 [Methylocystis sp.]|uniref:hypothetical protein n=1 Tax=Methylocystis sp. TaxID=1911079 RepID=UPI00392C7879
MTHQPYTSPIRTRKAADSFVVEDANGIALADVYFEDDSTRRGLVNRLSGADAKAGAQNIARALNEDAAG